MKPTFTNLRINIDNSTKDALRQLQERHPLGTISAVVTQAVNDALHRESGAERARQLLQQAGGDHAVAAELLLRQMHQKYRNFHSKRQPGKLEYDRIRKSLHTLSRMD